MSWKTAKPPWTLGGKYNKTSYNEGDKITTKANPVFVPATENAPGGTSVTVKHAPCGYWFSTPNVSFNSLNILGVEVAFCSNGSIVIGPGCEDGTCAIAYTTQGMSVNEEQTLSVTAPADNCIYSWAITSGGGSLSAVSGNSVNYTAPANNAGCINNPTITLTVLGSVCDTLEIAVNASTSTNEAVRIYTKTGAKPDLTWNYDSHCYILNISQQCDGSIYNTPINPCDALQVDAWGDDPALPNRDVYKAYTEAQKIARCMAHEETYICSTGGHSWDYWLGASPLDLRHEEWIAAGCCPEVLL